MLRKFDELAPIDVTGPLEALHNANVSLNDVYSKSLESIVEMLGPVKPALNFRRNVEVAGSPDVMIEVGDLLDSVSQWYNAKPELFDSKDTLLDELRKLKSPKAVIDQVAQLEATNRKDMFYHVRDILGEYSDQIADQAQAANTDIQIEQLKEWGVDGKSAEKLLKYASRVIQEAEVMFGIRVYKALDNACYAGEQDKVMSNIARLPEGSLKRLGGTVERSMQYSMRMPFDGQEYMKKMQTAHKRVKEIFQGLPEDVRNSAPIARLSKLVDNVVEMATSDELVMIDPKTYDLRTPINKIIPQTGAGGGLSGVG